MNRVIEAVNPYWKAVMAVAVPLFYPVLIDIFEALQGTFVDNPIAVAIVTGIAVFLKANK